MSVYLKDMLSVIKELDIDAMKVSEKRWNNIAKPLNGLGLLEEVVIKIAGITRNPNVNLKKRAVVVMCADNGVVEEGVTQTGQEVTAIVAANMVKGETSVNNMAKCVNVDVIPVDIGISRDMYIDGLIEKKLMYGTKNMTKEPAMTKYTAIEAVECGITIVKDLKDKGYGIIATGEMGIGNTTTSSAIAAVLLDRNVEEVTGRGAGLSSSGLDKKINSIKKAIEINNPEKEDPIDVLSKVGGLDIAGLVGVFIGGAALNIPIVIDGFISAVAALVAVKICPKVKGYIIPSHLSKEPAAIAIMEELNLKPFIDCNMCLGEGTGAVAVMPLLDMAMTVYKNMSTFEEINIDKYKPLS